MISICSLCCHFVILDTDSMRCSICEDAFHIKCTQLPETLSIEVRRRIDLQWSCERCTGVLRRSYPKELNSQSTDTALPRNTNWSHKKPSNARPAPYTRSIIGSNANCTILPVANPVRPTKRAWIHLSGLDNSVTVERVTSSVASLLGTDDVVAFSLLRKGDDAATVRSLSFKVGIPATLRAKVLDPSVWPLGLQVRDFVCDNVSRPTQQASGEVEEVPLKTQRIALSVTPRSVSATRAPQRKKVTRDMSNQPTIRSFFSQPAQSDKEKKL